MICNQTFFPKVSAMWLGVFQKFLLYPNVLWQRKTWPQSSWIFCELREKRDFGTVFSHSEAEVLRKLKRLQETWSYSLKLAFSFYFKASSILVCFSKRPFPTQKTKKEGWDEILGSWKLRSTLQVINIYWKVAKSTFQGKNKCNPLIAPAAGAAKFRRNQMNTNLTIKL